MLLVSLLTILILILAVAEVIIVLVEFLFTSYTFNHSGTVLGLIISYTIPCLIVPSLVLVMFKSTILVVPAGTSIILLSLLDISKVNAILAVLVSVSVTATSYASVVYKDITTNDIANYNIA